MNIQSYYLVTLSLTCSKPLRLTERSTENGCYIKKLFACDLLEVVNKVRLGLNRLVIKTKFATSKNHIQWNNFSESRGFHFKGKYHCTDDLLFNLFGFGCFAYAELATHLLVWSNPNQSNRRLTIQGYAILWINELIVLWLHLIECLVGKTRKLLMLLTTRVGFLFGPNSLPFSSHSHRSWWDQYCKPFLKNGPS